MAESPATFTATGIAEQFGITVQAACAQIRTWSKAKVIAPRDIRNTGRYFERAWDKTATGMQVAPEDFLPEKRGTKKSGMEYQVELAERFGHDTFTAGDAAMIWKCRLEVAHARIGRLANSGLVERYGTETIDKRYHVLWRVYDTA